MKKTKLIILLLSLLPLVVNAQNSLSIRQRRLLNLKALSVIEQYEMSQHLRDSESEFLFEDIFNDRKQLVFCDLVDYKSCKMIPLSEYMSAIKRRPSVSMEIGNLKRGKPIYKEGKWVLPVSFTKSVSYIDKYGLDFSTKNYYNSDYVISMELAYDEDRGICKVARMSGALQNSTVPPLPEHFMVVKRSDANSKNGRKAIIFDGMLRYDNKPLEFKGNYAILRDPSKKVESWNTDVQLKTINIGKTDAYNMVRYEYKVNHMRAKVRGAIAVGDVFKVKVCEGSNISTKSMGYEVGADIGVAFFAGKSSQIGLYTGAAWTCTGLNLMYKGPKDNGYSLIVKNGQDQYGDNKNNTRYYNIVKAEEALRFKDLTIPLYVNFEHTLHKSLALTWNLGAKIYINGQTEYSPLTITNANDVLNEDKLETTTITNYLVPVSYDRNFMDVSVIGGIALNVNLYKNILYTYAKFSYEYGLHSLFNGDYNLQYRKSLINNVASSSLELQEFCNPSKKIYPVVYDGLTQKDVANRSMLNSVCFDRSTMWVEFGFIFKF